MDDTPATLKRLGHALPGRLRLFKHHIVFKSERDVWICYPMVISADPCGSTLRLACKDFMIIALEFDNEKTCSAIAAEIKRLRSVYSTEELYAFVYTPATSEKLANGWNIYNATKEYERMGALTSEWRLTEANQEFRLCQTYPQTLAVPKTISDNVLLYAAKFRSKHRLPVLSYYLKLNKCTITRCSQPLVGIKQTRSMQDEALVCAIFATTEDPSDVRGKQTDHLIMDLRPATNAIAQVALGGGTESMDKYKPARKVYMGIDNLHVVRDSLNKVMDTLRHSDVGDEAPSPASLDKSQWLKMVSLLLQSSARVVEQVYFKCSHVVVHCSDGWDRTPQVTSLAMLCLDPYYRTLEGFMVLVEKEWVSFGHQFQTRSQLLKRGNTNSHNQGDSGNSKEQDSEVEHDLISNFTNFFVETARGRSDGPIFQQFLDCCYQLLLLFPTAFEFNERFLRRLLYHVYACQYGTFLFDCERELVQQEARQRTRSVWDYFIARKQQFINDKYIQVQQPADAVLVLPKQWQPRWWAGAFGRSDEDMNDRDAWRKRPVKNIPTTHTPSHIHSEPSDSVQVKIKSKSKSKSISETTPSSNSSPGSGPGSSSSSSLSSSSKSQPQVYIDQSHSVDSTNAGETNEPSQTSKLSQPCQTEEVYNSQSPDSSCIEPPNNMQPSEKAAASREKTKHQTLTVP